MLYASTKEDWRKWTFDYGILAVLYALDYFEVREDFEECAKIIDAIKEREIHFDEKLPKRLNSDVIQLVLDSTKNDPERKDNTLELYKKRALKIIESIKTK